MQKRYYFFLFLIVLASMSVGIFYYSSIPFGIGIHDDSVTYLTVAKEIREGNGAVTDFGKKVPMAKWPPLYPLVIAATSSLGMEPIESARIINILLFGGNIFLIGLFLYRMTHSMIFGLLGATVLIFTPAFIEIHALAISEPLFLFLALPSYFLLYESFDSDRESSLRNISAMGIGLACLTRYVGVAFIASGAFSILIYHRHTLFCRIKTATTYCLYASLPLVCWWVRNFALMGKIAGQKSHGFHPPGLAKLLECLMTLSKWIFPKTSPAPWEAALSTVVLFILLFAAGYLYFKLKNNEKIERSINMLLILGVFYGGLLFATLTLRHANLNLGNRLLIPLFVVGYLCACLLLSAFIKRKGMKFQSKVLGCSLVVCFLSFSLHSGIHLFSRIQSRGLKYSNKQWKHSKTLQKIRALPDDSVIYTNVSSNLIYLLTKRSVKTIPDKYSRFHPNNGTNGQQINAIKHRLTKNQGYLVFFHRKNDEAFRYKESELVELLNLTQLEEFKDGAIYKRGPLTTAP